MINTGYKIPYLMKKPVVFPLDGIPLDSIVRANSLVRLLRDFTLPVATVVNVTDGSAHSLFLDGVTISDSSISAIGADVRISDIHCQVGSGIDISQPTLSSMPDISIGGTIQKEASGIVVGSKTRLSGISMLVDSYTVPKNYTQISIWASVPSTPVGTKFPSYGVGAYINKQSANQMQTTSYGTTNTALNLTATGVDSSIGTVHTMAHDDDVGEYNIYLNELSNSTTVSANRRVAYTPATNYVFYSGGADWMCIADIMLDGTEYAEIVHNRLLKIFYP